MTKLNKVVTKLKKYNYNEQIKEILTPEILNQLTKIHEYKGKQKLFINQKKETLSSLMELAKIQSTDASNKIEGISTTDERLRLIALDKTAPTNRQESEIAGYRDVLNTIHESYEYIPITPSTILQLHRDLYKYSGLDVGGKYKNQDNVIAETLPNGTQRVRFQPVPAWQTTEAMEELCLGYNKAVNEDSVNPYILMGMFILDFLCIHPFSDGNGRMSRLLTILLLYKSGNMVGKYISVEKAIEQSKETYYESLGDSSFEWHDNKNTYKPFVEYMLGVILNVSQTFEDRVEIIAVEGNSKSDRIREQIKSTVGEITKSELVKMFSDISDTTVQRALNDLVKSKQIIKIGGGRYSKYIWNRELDS